MSRQGCTPFEVASVLRLHPDYDLAVRCLEYIRVNFGAVVPGYDHLPVALVALCHHHPANIYPALAVMGTPSDVTPEEIESFGPRIDAWIAAETLPVVIARAREVKAPTWAEVRGAGS